MLTKKIQVYNNTSFDPISYLTTMFQYFQKHGVTFNYDITNVTVSGYQSILTPIPLVGNAYVLKGVENLVSQTDHDIVLFIYDLNQWKAPWYWPYPLWNFGPMGNIPRNCTYMANGKPFITIGFYLPDSVNVQNAFLHEPMHALAKIFNCQDVMDTYLLNSTPDTPGGNFAQQWSILQPYLQSAVSPVDVSLTPKATLTRLSDNGIETLGNLTATNNGATFTCSTLELPWKNNQHDISCIPKGVYKASVQPFHNTQMYELSPTAPRTGIFIHPMNYYTQIQGCIGLGINPQDINKDSQIDITNSIKTIQSFMQFMENKTFELTIM